MRNPGHWMIEDYRQRMTTKEWQQILLDSQDTFFFKGNLRRLIGVKLGPGVYEVFKEPMKEEPNGKTAD